MSKKHRRYNVIIIQDPKTGKDVRVSMRKPHPPMSRERLYKLIEKFHPEHRYHMIREIKPLTSLSINLVCSCGEEFSITIEQQITSERPVN
jgi:hypothetical protein